MSRKVKLTPRLLRKIVLEERRKLAETLEQGEADSEKVKADEVDADSLADTLENDVDYVKALKIAESRAIRKIKKIREARKKLRKKIISQL